VADKDVEQLVSNLGGDDPFRATVVTAAARPPRPRVGNSPVPCLQRQLSPRIVNSPRPHVAPGTPLMTNRVPSLAPIVTPRCYTPRSRPSSARRSAALQKNDGKITVYVYNVHSSDKLILRLDPDLHIGSCCSPSHDPNDILSSPDSKTHLPRSSPSLKSDIAQSLGIDAAHIRLMFRGSPLGDEEKTLKCYGINDGDTVHLRVHRTASVGRNEVVLACAAKKCLERGEQEKDEKLCMRPFAMQSPSTKARVSERCAQNGAVLMPKWVSQDHPKLFAPVGAGIDGRGGDRAFVDFNSQGIWNAPVDHPNGRGQDQYGLQRVREGAHRAYGGA